MRFSVLILCTGNLCRSPAAEVIFRERAADLPISVASAGTAGVSGYDMDLTTAQAVRELGIDPSAHVARRLSAHLLRDADLVLTADSGHRSIAVQIDPLGFRRTFTLREFARLGQRLPPLSVTPTPDVLRSRVAEVAEQRGLADPGEPGTDDIADPLGAGIEVARSVVATISTSVDGVLHALAGRRDSSAPVPTPGDTQTAR